MTHHADCHHCYCQPGPTLMGVPHLLCCKCEDRMREPHVHGRAKRLKIGSADEATAELGALPVAAHWPIGMTAAQASAEFDALFGVQA